MDIGARPTCPRCHAAFRMHFARCPRCAVPLEVTGVDPLVGTVLGGRYVIEACIGEGGMGRVYRAGHQRVSRKFAVKVLYGDLAAEPKMQSRFVREAEVASLLSHPNLVSVVDFGETDAGLLYLVMDLVKGRNLASVVSAEAPFGRDRVIRLARQLCLGLASAHGQGLVHRDFKTSNIIVTQDGSGETARIVDFGIAMTSAADEQSDRLTTEGIVLGTPAYMAPEQAAGKDVDHRADLFSLGLIMYEMMSGVLPFEGSPVTIARMNLMVDPPPIATRVPGTVVDARLEGIAFKLMAKQPEGRYQSAHEVLAALDAAEARAEIGTASTVHMPTQTAEVARRAPVPAASGWKRWTVMAGGVVLIAGAALAGALTRHGSDERAGAAGTPGSTAPDQEAPAPVDDRESEGESAVPAIAAGPAEHARALPEDPGGVAGLADPNGPAGPAGPPAHAREASDRDTPVPAPPGDGTPAPRSDRKSSSRKAASEPPGNAELMERHRSVGRALERLVALEGEARAASLRERYFAIPIADALRNPALRDDVTRRLKALQRDIDRALRR